MEVCIVKPDRIFFKEEAEELLLPTNTGYIGILKDHAPLVTGLDNGVLAIRQDTTWRFLALLGGFGVVSRTIRSQHHPCKFRQHLGGMRVVFGRHFPCNFRWRLGGIPDDL